MTNKNAKRITILSGHYGSGKTNIAISIALSLKKEYNKVSICDIDIVNPYFRTKDSQTMLEENGVKVICSPYANSNVDIPALPQEIYNVTDDKSTHFVLDVGGDERGALALGRISPKIANENDYDMFFVVNFFRPLTQDVDGAIEVLKEIENACGLKFTGVINNSNLGRETTKELVEKTIDKAKELAKIVKIPYLYTTVSQNVYNQFAKKEGVFPIYLQQINA